MPKKVTQEMRDGLAEHFKEGERKGLVPFAIILSTPKKLRPALEEAMNAVEKGDHGNLNQSESSTAAAT